MTARRFAHAEKVPASRGIDGRPGGDGSAAHEFAVRLDGSLLAELQYAWTMERHCREYARTASRDAAAEAERIADWWHDYAVRVDAARADLADTIANEGDS